MAKKENPNYISKIDDRTNIIYPNYHDFESGQEPAIIVKGYNGTVEITQGDQSIIVPDNAREDLANLIKITFIV